jgi:hypothetical protein
VEKTSLTEWNPAFIRILPSGEFGQVQITATHFNAKSGQHLALAIHHLRRRGIFRVLVEDCAEHWHFTTADIVAMADSMRFLDIFEVKSALLSVVPRHLEDFRFAETALVNRGYDVRAFADMDSARDWLRGNAPG